MEQIVKIKKIKKTYEKDGQTKEYYRYLLEDEKGNKAYVKPLDETSKENIEEILKEEK